jgi:hypothetical protein
MAEESAFDFWQRPEIFPFSTSEPIHLPVQWVLVTLSSL